MPRNFCVRTRRITTRPAVFAKKSHRHMNCRPGRPQRAGLAPHMTNARRKSLRWRKHDYTGDAAYFITICTRDRQCVFANVVDGTVYRTRAGDIVDACWRAIPAHFPEGDIGHLDCDAEPPARHHRDRRCQTRGASLWQRGYHDHIIRDRADLARVRAYIEANPARGAEDEQNPGKIVP